MRGSGRRLVVDADIARAAGATADRRAQRCRAFLDEVMASGVRLAWSRELNAEWRRHGSSRATRWLAAMASRGRLVWPEVVDLKEISVVAHRRRHAGHLRPTCPDAIDKDLHLVELALGADRAIASMDEKVRRCLVELCQASGDAAVKALWRLVWVNPERDDDDARGWAKAGCPDRGAWRLVRDT